MSLPAVVVAYFDHLASGRFEDAARCFSADGFYSHPAYDPGASGPTATRLEARGRDEIRKLFELRGVRAWTHESRSDTIGSRFYVEGRVREADGSILLSYLAAGLLVDGLISRYVAYDARPPVGDTEASA